jgi:uncharacterized membrane protein YkoI
MNTQLCILAGATLAAGLAFADEKPVKLSDLPPAVQKAIETQTKGAEIKGFSMETEKGRTFYEAETRLNGHGRDLLFDKTGALVEVEEETQIDSIPAPARNAIHKKAGDGKVLKVEMVTSGSSISYEAEIEKNGKKSEFAVKSDGTASK